MKKTDQPYKPSRIAAADDFLELVPSASDIDGATKRIRQKYAQLRLSLQPFILAVGNSWRTVEQYVCVLDTNIITFRNIRKAVDFAYKACWVLEVSHSFASVQTWEILQVAIYGMKKEEKIGIPASNLAARIENFLR